mgnify:CR=1 FL=1
MPCIWILKKKTRGCDRGFSKEKNTWISSFPTIILFTLCLDIFLTTTIPHCTSQQQLFVWKWFLHSYKDAIRECGGLKCLCRLLNVTRGPAVQEHIIVALGNLAFQNARLVYIQWTYLRRRQGVSLRAGYQANWTAVKTVLPGCFQHLCNYKLLIFLRLCINFAWVPNPNALLLQTLMKPLRRDFKDHQNTRLKHLLSKCNDIESLPLAVPATKNAWVSDYLYFFRFKNIFNLLKLSLGCLHVYGILRG